MKYWTSTADDHGSLNINNNNNHTASGSYLVGPDPFSVKSPVECSKLQIVGYSSIMLFVLSFFSNFLLLWSFVRNKKQRSKMNTFVVALTFINLIGTVIEWPVVITNHLNCK